MKTQIIIIIVIVILLLNNCYADQANYRLNITNQHFTSEKSIEFDIVLKSDSQENLLYFAGQYFIELGTNLDDSKYFNCSIVNSDLPVYLQPVNPRISNNILILSCNKLEKGNLFVVGEKQVLIAKVNITLNSETIPTEKLNLKWTDKNNKLQTRILTSNEDKAIEITNAKNHFSDFDNSNNLVEVNSLSLPDKFELYQNYPNPFNPDTKIKFEIPLNAGEELQNVHLVLYDISGKELVTFVNKKMNAGRFEVTFNGANYASGVYFYKLTSGEFTSVKRMVLLK